ncbi:nucleoside hydrolase [Galbitalea sp. SE-J8]|uniref:nucleoside hydrolase n=1 Tax=Galbitalea sp. SE-J8 TaxID=3054952 RepID=UPI00259CCBC5|nr:nucleoside hydrolase [Galbitalea sp. SE-J8]MDM4762756.1 nucleoside hydrolase [Galbitalea sp. SE-J8]
MRSIILDCDPGHDDAVAMLLAWGSPVIDLVAVTTVFGNQTLDRVTRNALGVAAVAGIHGIPFAAGADRPLVRELATAGDFHGESGLDGPELPAASVALDPRHAAQLIIDLVMAAPTGTITLVPTAALTNIALAARLEPRIVPRVREVVLMGGGYGGGNWTAAAEFNILADPEAAHIVFGAGWPVTMAGLDVTHRALATPDVVADIVALGTPVARFVDELMGFFRESYRSHQGFEHPPVHDAVAVAYVADPAVLTVRRAPVSIELTGTHTLGMTLADLRGPAPDGTTTSIATGIDVPRFWALVTDAIARIR